MDGDGASDGDLFRAGGVVFPAHAEERHSLEATRLRVVAARPEEDVASLSRRTGNVWGAPDTAAFNGVFVNHRFDNGWLVKIARSEPYVPRKP